MRPTRPTTLARRAAAVLVAVTSVAVATPATPAGAAAAEPTHTWRASDKSHDVLLQRATNSPRSACGYRLTARRGVADPVPDLTAIGLTLSPTTVTVEAQVRRLPGPGGKPLSTTFQLLTNLYDANVFYYVDGNDPANDHAGLVAREETRSRKASRKADACGDYTYGSSGTPCAALKAERVASTRTLRVTLPLRCLGNPRWVRLGATVASADVRRRGATLRSDTWGVREKVYDPKHPYTAPHYGAKVTVPAAQPSEPTAPSDPGPLPPIG